MIDETWAAFAAGGLPTELARVKELLDTESDPGEPYRTIYDACETLERVQQRASAITASSACGTAAHGAASLCVDRMRLERGLALLQTDMLCEGEPLVTQALQRAGGWPLWESLRAHNALGALWCDRDNAQLALKHLQQADVLYQQQRCSSGGSAARRGAPSDAAGALGEGMHRLEVGDDDSGPGAAAAASPAADGAATAGAGAEPEVGTDGAGGQILPAVGTAAAAAAGLPVMEWAKALQPADLDAAIEDAYTQTLFFLAQVHGMLRDKAASAAFCGATLNRQASQPGALDLDEWVQNALQLSGFYIDQRSFALARYCLEAVRALLQQRRQPAFTAVDRRGAATAAAAGPGDDPGDGGGPGADVRAAAGAGKEKGAAEGSGAAGDVDRRPSIDTGHSMQRQDQETTKAAAAASGASKKAGRTGKTAEGGGAAASWSADAMAACKAAMQEDLLALLDEDVRANVALAWGKLFLYRLVASHDSVLLGRTLEASGPGSFPAAARFDQLQGVPPLESLPEWGTGALVSEYEEARALANAALPLLSRALAHYQLDGWVSEHVGIQLEVSNVYRLLADFDPDPQRRAATHLLRTRVVGPLVGAFSSDHYPGLSKSVVLETANAWREVAGAREDHGAAPSKVALAARKASSHYQHFLDSLGPGGAAGKLPGRIDGDNEAHAVRAAFHAGCLLHTAIRMETAGAAFGGKGDGSSSSEQHPAVPRGAAQKLLRWMADYVNRHGLTEFDQEAELAAELADLLDQREQLLDSQAAQHKGMRGAVAGARHL